MKLNPFADQMVLSGDVAYYRFIMRMDDFNDEEAAWSQLLEARRPMEDEMRKITQDTLGTEFSVRSVTPIRGSIEILVVVGTTYYAVSKYKNFVDSLELLRNQLEGLIRRFFRRGNYTVSSSLTLGPTVVAGGMPVANQFDSNKLLLAYLILSHAAMLALFIWIILRRIGTP